MYIYVRKTSTTESQLEDISGRIYSVPGVYYAYTDYSQGDENEYYQINIEVPGTNNKIKILELIDDRFDIIRVDPSKGGEEVEREAINWWRQDHQDSPLPKKIP